MQRISQINAAKAWARHYKKYLALQLNFKNDRRILRTVHLMLQFVLLQSITQHPRKLSRTSNGLNCTLKIFLLWQMFLRTLIWGKTTISFFRTHHHWLWIKSVTFSVDSPSLPMFLSPPLLSFYLSLSLPLFPHTHYDHDKETKFHVKTVSARCRRPSPEFKIEKKAKRWPCLRTFDVLH